MLYLNGRLVVFSTENDAGVYTVYITVSASRLLWVEKLWLEKKNVPKGSQPTCFHIPFLVT